MLVLAAVLSVFIGLSLGLLGGGGSILTLPILVYALGVDTKEAITTSLLVVGVTSAVGAIPKALAGHVRWRTALLFGAAGMTGAYGGGRLAAYVPANLLLLGFALMMAVTAAAMLRKPKTALADAPPARDLPALKVLVQGVAVGLVTGLVGAGGGFLIVPALVVLGGLPMNAAIGTSLVVIAMQSLAGFAGHLHGVTVDAGLAFTVTAAAVAGSLAGARLSSRVSPSTLRTGFGWFVVAMAVFLLAQQLPKGTFARVLEVGGTPLAALAGGVLIGLSATLLLLFHGKVAGISGILGQLLQPKRGDTAWRVAFLSGLVGGGAALGLLWPGAYGVGPDRSTAALIVAGLLVGYGTRLGNGCTSGHGVCGISRMSPRSLIATLTFMASGGLTVLGVRVLFGGVL